MKLLRQLAFTLLILCSSAAFAQLSSLTDGAVYHFQNVGNTGIALGASALSDVAGVSSDKGNKYQQWYVKKSGANYTFRNLGNGRYLQGAGASASWGLAQDASSNANLFELATIENSNNITIRSKAHDGNTYGYMHKDGSNNIVGWETAAAATQWTITTIEYSEADLNAIWDEIAALIPDEETVRSYESALYAIFADSACTKLNSTYVSMEVESIKTDANYLKLPAELQAMVLKVRSRDWAEANAIEGKDKWSDEYARKFRVQMYEPYSIEGEITSYLRFNAHSNMDNPTGLFANSGQPMYIMVEGKIAEGAELWVAHVTGHGLTSYYNNSAYTQLKEGLNVIPYFSDGSQLWINYVVHTYNSSGATIKDKFPHKISDFKPLKIHIEGGYINGYYNAIGDFRAADSETENLWGEVDNDADWAYYKERAPLNGTDAPNRDFPLLGHRQTLLFEFGNITDDGGKPQKGISYWLDAVVNHEDVTKPYKPYNSSGDFSDYTGMGLDANTGRINIMIEAWDRIMYSELATMGLVSASTMDKMNEMYPRWTADDKKAEIYNYGKSAADQQTYIDFCQGIDYSEYFNHHGAAVGSYSGYMSGGWRCCNYHYNTMGDIIGKIANEAGPTWGPAHEIGHQHQGTFNLNGQTEVTNNFFSNVAVWYMGMGTSRYNGSEGNLQHVLEAFNKEGNDAYTNNIWALTHIYYRLWLYYHLAGNNTQFWPRLYELCRRVPIVNGGQISGETSLLRFYQHACDAAGEDLTEFFRAHGYLEVMENRLVGDYSNGIYNQTQEQIDAAIAAVKAKNYPQNLAVLFINDGTSNTGVQHDGVTARSLWDGNPSADYGSVTDFIKGDVSVSTNYTASVDANGNVTMSGGSGGIGFVILNEKGEIVSFSNKSSFPLSDEVAHLVATGVLTISSIDDESEITEAEIDLSALQSGLLRELIDKAQAIINLADDTNTKVGFYKPTSIADLVAACDAAKEQLSTGVALGAAYEKLYTEYKNVQNDEYAVIKIMPGSTYAIQNKTGKDYMSVNIADNKIITNSTAPANEPKNRWVFEQGSTSGRYKIKNVSTKTYLQAVTDANSVDFTVGDAAVDYIVSEVGSGYLALSTAAVPERYMDRHSADKVATWDAKGDNASWYITLVEENEEIVNTDKLSELIDKTEALIGKMAVLGTLKTNLPLQVTNSSNPYFISCSNLDSSEGSDMNYLIDNKNNTYIHSNWHSVSASNDWLDVDLGSGNKLSMFAFSEVTRSGASADFPKTIEIYGSNTKSNNTSDYTLIATVIGLPQSSGQTWESDAVIAAEGYRYLRFVVTTGNNRIYFHMAEFDLYSIDYDVTKLEGFSSVDDNLVKDAYINMLKGKAWLTRNDATAANITAAEGTLETAYEELKTEYNNALIDLLAEEKKSLQALINKTNELIDEVGAAEVAAGGIIDLHGKLYCNSVYTAGGTNDSDYSSAENNYNLLDGNTGTHYHSDYNYSTMVSDPYIRVDLGEKNKASKFRFNYTTRNLGSCAPTAISVYGGNYDADALGSVTTSKYLGSVTKPTRIAIKNISDNNDYYFAGVKNVQNYSKDVILVWEPVTEGTAGSYYLRLEKEGDNGYLQQQDEPEIATISLGTKDNAQEFYTVEPTANGSGATKYSNTDGKTNENLVRFVSKGGGSWLNCQGKAANPKYVSGAFGSWTVHNVYLIGSTTFSDAPVAQFTSSDSEKPLPTGTAAYWESGDIIADQAYRYYKFVVTKSQGTKTENSVTKYYFAISEFGFTKSAIRDVTIYDEFINCVSEELLLNTRAVVNDSETLIKNATTTEQLKKQTSTLQAVYDALLAEKCLAEMYPSADKFYRLTSAINSGGYMYNDKTNLDISWSTSVADTDSRGIWQFEEKNDKFYLKNLHTDCAVVKNTLNNVVKTGEQGTAVEIRPFSDEQIGVYTGGGNLLYANSNGNVVANPATGEGTASAWYLTEVDPENMENISYSLKISPVGWSTLYLNYPVTVPKGVTAFAATKVDGTTITLESVGDVIPKGTAVILKGTAGSIYNFVYTTENSEFTGENKLKGTFYDSFITAVDGYKYFILAAPTGYPVGLYEIEKEDGRFKNNANRVYLPILEINESGVNGFSLRISDGATGVEEVVGNTDCAAPEGIYDLSGRRVKEITESGIYIVNGKKYIKK